MRVRRALLLVSAILATLLFASPALDKAGASSDSSAILAVHVKGNKLVNGSGERVRLLGVDANGTESACIHHRNRVGMGPLNAQEARAIARWGADAVRVPLNEDCWLGINGLPFQSTSSRYRAGIKRWVGDLNSAGLVVILDLHWSAPGNEPSTNLWPMPDQTHTVAFWHSVATTFRANSGVVFDLFNEPALGGTHPSQSDWACWRNGCNSEAHTVSYRVAGMQELLDTVRKTGARQPAMVGGLNWAGDPCGVHDAGGNDGQCMWLKYHPTDPDHGLVVSFHTYDKGSECHTVGCWDASVAPVARQFPLVTGELGEKACSSTYVITYMHWADQHSISYLVWSWQPRQAGTCSQQGTRLISSWSGTTNSANPAPAAVQAHLRDQLRSQGKPA